MEVVSGLGWFSSISFMSCSVPPMGFGGGIRRDRGQEVWENQDSGGGMDRYEWLFCLTIHFSIINPRTPKEFGFSNDARRMGLGLKYLKNREVRPELEAGFPD